MPRLISTYRNQNELNQVVARERPSPEGWKEKKADFNISTVYQQMRSLKNK